MGVITWIILGAIAGFIGSKIFEGSGKGFLMNTALGIVGAVVGGFVANMIGFSGVSGFNIWSILIAILGAIIVLWGYNKLTGDRL
ncbi:MAG: GlsB/YeaQ/YmgE family stress response membrane protein [Rhizobiales bacterium]|nr:GlsB/YeaQ/YmgE family stress response membrane protein [Hyphomicrobiales bacterium]